MGSFMERFDEVRDEEMESSDGHRDEQLEVLVQSSSVSSEEKKAMSSMCSFNASSIGSKESAAV